MVCNILFMFVVIHSMAQSILPSSSYNWISFTQAQSFHGNVNLNIFLWYYLAIFPHFCIVNTFEFVHSLWFLETCNHVNTCTFTNSMTFVLLLKRLLTNMCYFLLHSALYCFNFHSRILTWTNIPFLM